MAWAFQNANRDVACGAFFGRSQCVYAFCGRHIQRHCIRGISRSNGQFFHVSVGGMQHRPTWAHRDDGQRVWHILGGQCRAFKRVKRDVHTWSVSCANLFPDIQHGRFVAFAFADNDNTCDV